jgi:3-(3-hydroxy-phenyl)propionate hydroxylase
MTASSRPVADAPQRDRAAGEAARACPVLVVGAGPVGLCAAIDLAQQGVPVLLVTDNEIMPTGSRAVCYAKRSLEILDRLGVGEACVRKGLAWETGRVYLGERQVYSFHLQPERDHERPAFINLQQFYLERFLLERARALPNLELRWGHRVVAVAQTGETVRATVEAAGRRYHLDAAWLLACDGAHSTVRRLIKAPVHGVAPRDRFLIVDVVTDADLPVERRFWFDPPFHRGRAALMHKQPDNVWRIELQLAPDAVPAEEMQPEKLMPLVRTMLGAHGACELKWVSLYAVTQQRLERLRHGRILFAGDAAHQVSPFGARGFNSGVQDTDNLAWKLKLVLDGRAPETLLDSYSDERVAAAEENLVSDRGTIEFIAPADAASRAFRDAVLSLAPEYGFARRMVNSGRLATPCVYGERLNTPDHERFFGGLKPGAPASDAPVAVNGAAGWFLRQTGNRFYGMYFTDGDMPAAAIAELDRLYTGAIPVVPLIVAPPGGVRKRLPAGWCVVEDLRGLLQQRFDGMPGSFYLLRPDQHVAARWRRFDPALARIALARATGTPSPRGQA